MLSDKDVTQYILTGRLGKNEIGLPVNKSTGKWADSVNRHSNGMPLLYLWTWKHTPVNVVVSDREIVTAIVLHLKDWEGTIEIHEGGHRLKLAQSTSLDELLRFFNLAGMDWQFHFIFEKVVIVRLAKNEIEFVFSYYPGESNELQMIQNALPPQSENPL